MVTGRSETNPTCLQWRKIVRQWRALDLRTRATTSTRIDLVVFKAALLSLLKEVKPSTDRKKIKLLTFDNYDTTTFSLKLVIE